VKYFLIGLTAFIFFIPHSCSEEYSDIRNTLDKKVSYSSYGKDTLSQLNNIAAEHHFTIEFTGNTKELLSVKSKKFHYPDIRLRFLLRRLCRDAQVDFKVTNTNVMIYLPKKDISNSIANKNL
jgi:hypothetical protein